MVCFDSSTVNVKIGYIQAFVSFQFVFCRILHPNKFMNFKKNVNKARTQEQSLMTIIATESYNDCWNNWDTNDRETQTQS